MTTTAAGVEALDALSPDAAAEQLRSCCGSSEWVRRMVARRPFGSVAGLLAAAGEEWWALAPSDWFEAFAHHPRIGERAAAVAPDARARAWSAGEQRGAAQATDSVRDALAAGNREYERRFGHIYLVRAAGRDAEELLAILRSRLTNDSATELRVAAAEQAAITRLRLDQLLASFGPPAS